MRYGALLGSAILLIVALALHLSPAPAEEPASTSIPLSPIPVPPYDSLSSPAPTEPPVDALRVLHVLDGDTIILTNGQRVRYIGVDTPERDDPRLREAALRATDANRALVEGKSLRIEEDLQKTDRYGRTLAYVWAERVFINEALLRQGWARLLTIPPNVRYIERFREAARAGTAQRDQIWRASTAGSIAGAELEGKLCPSGTPVKGNITQQGEKIYHLPSGAFYDRTRPEACFEDARAAETAGYRASRR